MPNACSCCQTEFAADVELFPKLIVTRDERVARELMDDKDEVLLCMKCWFADVKRIPSEDLAMALMGLLKKVKAAEATAGANNWTDILEKLKEKDANVWKGPYVTPNQQTPYYPPQWGGPVWVDGTSGTLPNDVTYTSSDGNYCDHSQDLRGLYVGTKGKIQRKDPGENPG